MIYGVTGHRPSKTGGYTRTATDRLLQFAGTVLRSYSDLECVITGMALGWDIAIAKAALANRILYDAYIPFVGQEKLWPVDAQEQYQYLLSQARIVKVVCDGEYAPWKMQKRNEAVVDDCRKLVSLWDGSAGGTANCVKYAQSVGREVDNVWGLWERYR